MNRGTLMGRGRRSARSRIRQVALSGAALLAALGTQALGAAPITAKVPAAVSQGQVRIGQVDQLSCNAFSLQYTIPPTPGSTFAALLTGPCTTGTLTDLHATGTGTITVQRQLEHTAQANLNLTFHNLTGGVVTMPLAFQVLAVDNTPPIFITHVGVGPVDSIIDTVNTSEYFEGITETAGANSPLTPGFWQESCVLAPNGYTFCTARGSLTRF